MFLLNKILFWEGFVMLKFLSKIAEKYAKSTNSACAWFGFLHQPTMPKSLIRED